MVRFNSIFIRIHLIHTVTLTAKARDSYTHQTLNFRGHTPTILPGKQTSRIKPQDTPEDFVFACVLRFVVVDSGHFQTSVAVSYLVTTTTIRRLITVLYVLLSRRSVSYLSPYSVDAPCVPLSGFRGYTLALETFWTDAR